MRDPELTTRVPTPDATAPPAPPAPPAPAAPAPAWTTAPPAPPPQGDPWRPARYDDPGRLASLLFGLLLLGIGLWFFADHTLGLDLPRIRWNQLWPLILIVIGLWVLLGSRRRRR
ncbi:MAG: DUF5668 domain-containing protein [Chloroflexota bacterium]